MKKSYIFITAAALTAMLLTGCGSSEQTGEGSRPAASDENYSAEVTQTPDNPAADFDLTRISEACRTSKLLEKYGGFTVSYEMDYGEVYKQTASFGANSEGKPCYVMISDTDIDYNDGTNQYWVDNTTGEGYATLNLEGAPEADMENYIFTYSPEDQLKVTDYTRNEDGSYIISAAETYTETYEDENGQPVNFTYKYEYVLTATADLELTEMKSVCTDIDSGEVDSRLEMKVEYGTAAPKAPEFMNDTFVVTVIMIVDEKTEVTQQFDIPTGFYPFFATPEDGEYVFSYDRYATEIIEDFSEIKESVTIFAVNSSKLAVG